MTKISNIIFLLIVTLSLMLAFCGCFQRQFFPGFRELPSPPLMQALDEDENGELSAEEIENSTEALLELDEDENGSITKDELFPRMPNHGGMRGGVMRGGMPPQDMPGMGEFGDRPQLLLMEALDTDGNGILSTPEIKNAPSSLKKLDLNKDGILVKEELFELT